MDITLLYKRIVGDLENGQDRQQASGDQKYHKYDYHSYGFRAPALAALVKNYLPLFKKLDLGQRFFMIDRFYDSRIEEQVLIANAILEISLADHAPAVLEQLDRLAANLVSWSTTDNLCIDVIQPLLLRFPDEILSLLTRWNASDNLWKQRASLVSFTRKAGESGRYTDQALAFSDRLIHSKDDLIRKAIGWALKDAMRGDKEKVLSYVRNLRREKAPSTITLYAIRDLKGSERDAIMAE